MVTIRDVAKLAGVSASTASRILSDSTKEKFSSVTRQKVVDASRELGYHPNFAARALVSGQTRIIAVVFPRNHGTPFTALASLQIMSGIEDFCSNNGYHMLITSPRIEDGQLESHLADLLTGGYLDGAIVDGHTNATPIMNLITELNVPAVVLGPHPHTFSLTGDNVEGGRLLMSYLLKLGHQHIGIISLPAIQQRLDGVRLAADEAGIDFDSFPLHPGDFSEDSGAIAAEYLITTYPEITALIAFNDRMAMGAMNRLKALGYRIPEDISVVGYDDLPRSRDFNPPLTTINHRLSEWGGLAMGMLLEVLKENKPESIVLAPELVVRKTTAPPRKTM